MGEVVNLREVRKRRERAAKEALAAENRAKHGRTKVQSQEENRDRDRRALLLDQSKLDAPKEGSDA